MFFNKHNRNVSEGQDLQAREAQDWGEPFDSPLPPMDMPEEFYVEGNEVLMWMPTGSVYGIIRTIDSDPDGTVWLQIDHLLCGRNHTSWVTLPFVQHFAGV